MKIKHIHIELELEPDDIEGHATEIHYDGKLWKSNGPMYSRVMKVLSDLVSIVRR